MLASYLSALTCGLIALGPNLLAQAQEPPPIEQEELVARLGHLLDSLSRADRFSGVVLLAAGDSVIFEHAYGLADREAGRQARPDTRFNIGSINKVFTATAIRQLAAQGRLSLDDPIVRYLPDYPNPAAARQITVRQLLDHTAGLGGNIFDAPPGGTRASLRRNEDFIPLFAREPLAFQPGTQRRYCNPCYVLLGAIIARASGASYYDYVREHIYRPAGMNATDSYALDSLPENTAVGYTRGEPGAPPGNGPLRRNTDLLPARGSAAGGGYSTARDLFAFARALRYGRIPGAPPGAFAAAGGAPGLNALLESGLGGRYTLVVLANLDPPAAEDIGARVRHWLGVRDEP